MEGPNYLRKKPSLKSNVFSLRKGLNPLTRKVASPKSNILLLRKNPSFP